MNSPGDESPFVVPNLSLLGQEHVKQYQQTNGEVGHIWNGVTTLLLTTLGNKSGQWRTTPLIYGCNGSEYLVIASKGGAPSHPAWYLNLLACPDAEIQVKDKKMKVKARTADESERESRWQIMSKAWPNYDQYAQRTTRIIPVVILQPVENPI